MARKQRMDDDGLRELRVSQTVHARILKLKAERGGQNIPTIVTELLTTALDALDALKAKDTPRGRK
jgi:hypothetical protein